MAALTVVLVACLLASPAGVQSATPSPSCSEGPERVAGTIYGTPCDDRIVAPPGVAAVDGGGGDDTIVPAPIAAASSCPAGCFLDVGSQTFEGGPGDDIVFGERGNDRLFGGEGNDQLFGGIGDDLVEGGSGDDRVSGGFGADFVEGNGGNDYVRGDATADRRLGGGSESDTISFSTGVTPGFFNSHGIDFSSVPGLPGESGERGLYLDLAAGVSDNGVAPFGGGVDAFVAADFETVIGTPFSDYIRGTDGDETIYGGGGGDVIFGRGGDDAIYGGADGDDLHGESGSDSGDGNAGDDHCDGLESPAGCEPVASGVVPRDSSKIAVGMLAPESTPYTQLYLAGSGGTDKVTATWSASSVTFALASGSAAFDTATASSSGCAPAGGQVVCTLARPLDSIVLAGLDGDDSLEATGFPATASVVVAGGEGDDALTGGEQSEDVLADGPDEKGAGDDVLDARGRDDAVLNNEGEDELLGGTGNDLFLSDSLCDGDQIVGGSGRDNASWAKFDPPGAAGVAARLDPGDVGEPGAGGLPDCGGATLGTLAEVEDLEGSPGDDAFYGDGGNNQLLGWAGNDVYSAGAGEDRILANSGDFDPTIECGADDDTALIDYPVLDPHDVAAADCEQVREAEPNSFRIDPEPEVPTEEPAPTVPPPAPPTKAKGGGAGKAPLPCLVVERSGTARCLVRPRRLVLADGSTVKSLRWTSWTRRRAIGLGRLISRVRGTRLSAPARLSLTAPKQCAGQVRFTRLALRYGRGYRKAYSRTALGFKPCAIRLRPLWRP